MYGIDLPLIQPWTSEPAVIDIVSYLFDVTSKLVESPSSPTSPAHPTLQQQLPDLASVLFYAFHEWCAWLSSPLAASDPAHTRAQIEFEERFSQARPVVLDTLRRSGFVEHAFTLAEKYHDFRSLAGLCHSERDKVYPPEVNPYQERVRRYIDKYKEPFAEEVCAWYVEHGEFC